MTTFTAIPDPDAGSVLLQVADAPSPGAPVYTGDAEDGTLGGWAATSAVGLVNTAADPIAGGRSWRIDWPGGPTPGDGAYRAITGLVVGTRYRATATVRLDGASPAVRLNVYGQGVGAPTYAVDVPAQVSHEWVATAASHTLRVEAAETDVGFGSAYFDDLSVQAVPPGPTTLTRTDVNGTAPVRLLPGQEPIGGSMVVDDHEAALAGLVRYDLTDGAGTLLSASVTLDAPAPRLTLPVLPQLDVALELVTGYTDTRTPTGVLHQVINRADPVPAGGPMSTRSGTLTLVVRDFAEVRAVSELYARGQVVLMRQPTHPGMDLYHRAERLSSAPDGTRWRVEVGYREVANPAAPLEGTAGWTFDDVAATYPTFSAVRDAYPTFSDLTVGPVS